MCYFSPKLRDKGTEASMLTILVAILEKAGFHVRRACKQAMVRLTHGGEAICPPYKLNSSALVSPLNTCNCKLKKKSQTRTIPTEFSLNS